MINHSLFVFGVRPCGHAYIGKIPAGLSAKKAVLEAVGNALAFPDYFGGNWDSFEECVRDLNWLPEGLIILEHEDVPLEGDGQSLKMYLEILSDATADLKNSGLRTLRVVFPKWAESAVRSTC